MGDRPLAAIPVHLLDQSRNHALLLARCHIGHSATSLPFIVAATQIGVALGVVTKASAAALTAAGLLSVIIFPATGLSLLRRGRPEEPDKDQTPAMPLVTVEDRALCRVGTAASG
jgi:hypothetical protein